MKTPDPTPPRLTIIIPTKDRAEMLSGLFESLSRMDGLSDAGLEIIVADNDSTDGTQAILASVAARFPARISAIKIARPGKSAAMNDALRLASGDYVAFLDDDVVVDRGWLRTLEDFFRRNEYRAAQGTIRLYAPGIDDPEVSKLISRYRTIPHLEYDPDVNEVHSLNGANFVVSREVLKLAGGFDERLGPGASGTSEDVELARRLTRSGIRISYLRDCVVHHRIDPSRLSERYFEELHRRQGRSRLLIKDRSLFRIASSLGHAYLQYAYSSISGNERRHYRSLGRIYHYGEMAKAKRRGIPLAAAKPGRIGK